MDESKSLCCFYHSVTFEGKIDMKNEKGSIELIVLGLLAALIVVLAVPLLGTIGTGVNSQLNTLNSNVN